MAIPIYGTGIFNVAKESIHYTIMFDYYDANKEYYNLIKRQSNKINEEKRLKEEMQKEINTEKTIINGNHVFPVIKYAKIGYKIPKISFVVFYIEIPFNLIKGKNTYENIYEETTAEYDYFVTWILPRCGKFIKIDSQGIYDIYGNYSFIFIQKGMKISGYESIVFELQDNCF
ncbi:hypothetical protein Calag_0989 [Caldisphaera lagunensis DSM 15908]|uniref:Uncharacterized protein n=1 Tax=Caldisphaera lagunensis (strain DSM 15908 / JCM 11604 / ANMR 0165 / IC-154) TaxID=1056495 RepID=L0AC56_CALLD|nr:hypothetical protein [Caldisphaera lagunensis]AFZ70712.1 hypothetical protein Calag_0989 [Caldisphaera lagunensis DSM 15908]